VGRLLNATVSGALTLGLVVLGLVMAGCGSSGAESQSAQSANASKKGPKGVIKVVSPAFEKGGAIPAHYTCDGADTSPPLRWTKAPEGTAELVLLIVDQSGHGPGGEEIIWSVAGLQPQLTSIAPGKLPAGAVVGRNGRGHTHYSVCPRKGSGVQQYAVFVGAMPHHLSLHRGFSRRDFSRATGGVVESAGITTFSYQRVR